MSATHINLQVAFLERQKLLSQQLGLPLEFTKHPTAIGEASEADWARMLRSFLPGRYEVGPVFALDIDGLQSEQIDLAVFDRQYSPLWFESAGKKIVPAESIYAAFEVKQNINKRQLDYAARKVASVRRLHRDSAHIVDIYGTQPGPHPDTRPILGGILALRSDWSDGIRGATALKNITSHAGDEHLDFGIALLDGAFDHVPATCNQELLTPGLQFSKPDTQLIWFVMRLFRRLQSIGTALAVDLSAYERVLDAVEIGPAASGTAESPG